MTTPDFPSIELHEHLVRALGSSDHNVQVMGTRVRELVEHDVTVWVTEAVYAAQRPIVRMVTQRASDHLGARVRLTVRTVERAGVACWLEPWGVR